MEHVCDLIHRAGGKSCDLERLFGGYHLDHAVAADALFEHPSADDINVILYPCHSAHAKSRRG